MARTKKVQENEDIENELEEDLELEVVEKKPRKSTKTAKAPAKKAPAKKSRSKKEADDDEAEAEIEINSEDETRKAETQSRNRRPPREPVDATRPACEMSILDLLRHLMQRGADQSNPNPTLRNGASDLLNELTRGPGRRRGGAPRFGSKTAAPDAEPEQSYTRSRPRYGSKTAAVRHNPGQRQPGSKSNHRNRDGLY